MDKDVAEFTVRDFYWMKGHDKAMCARPQQERAHRFGQEEP